MLVIQALVVVGSEEALSGGIAICLRRPGLPTGMPSRGLRFRRTGVRRHVDQRPFESGHGPLPPCGQSRPTPRTVALQLGARVGAQADVCTGDLLVSAAGLIVLRGSGDLGVGIINSVHFATSYAPCPPGATCAAAPV